MKHTFLDKMKHWVTLDLAEKIQFLRYKVYFERTLRGLEEYLHESDDQNEIIQKALETGCISIRVIGAALSKWILFWNCGQLLLGIITVRMIRRKNYSMNLNLWMCGSVGIMVNEPQTKASSSQETESGDTGEGKSGTEEDSE